MLNTQSTQSTCSIKVNNNKFPFLMPNLNFYLEWPVDIGLWNKVLNHWQGECKQFTAVFRDGRHHITLEGDDKQTRVLIAVLTKDNKVSCANCSNKFIPGFLCLICGQCSDCGCLHD